MKRKKITISGLIVSALLGISAISFAGMGIPGGSTNTGTEAGVAVVAGEKAKTAAANFDYHAAQLAQVGTEAGVGVIAGERAKNAAANFDYNAVQLAWVGTEAGHAPTGLSTDPGSFNAGTTSEQVAEKCINDNALLQSC